MAVRTTNWGESKPLLPDLSPGCAHTRVTMRGVGLGDLLREALVQLGPSPLVLCAWSVSLKELQHIDALLKSGQVTDFFLLVSRDLATRHPTYAAAVETFGPDRWRVSRIRAHFAIVGDVVIRGSGGLGASRGVNVWDVDWCADLARFFRETVEEISGAMPEGWASSPEVDRASRLRGKTIAAPFPVSYDLGF